MKDNVGGSILILLIVIMAIGMSIFIARDIRYNQSITEHYTSICDCGGTYKFINAANFGGRAFYYWQCDECGKAINTEYLLKGGNENE